MTSLVKNYSQYLAKRTQEFLAANDQEILRFAAEKNPDLILRIENFRREKMTAEEQLQNSTEAILEAIRTTPLVRAHFRKDPTRQSIHEITQIEWIRQNAYADVRKMLAGRGGTYFHDYKLCTDHPRPSSATKTLDIRSDSSNMYGVLKYSTTEGGAQDNQFRDVKHFIEQMRGYLQKNPTASELFLFYLDGPYYTEKKRSELKAMIPVECSEKIRITSVSEILGTDVPAAAPAP